MPASDPGELPDDPSRPGEPDAIGPGMGSSPSGPSFAPGAAPPGFGARPLGPPPLPRPDPAAFRPPRTVGPLVLTLAAVMLVALVVVTASVLAYRADREAGRSPAVTSTTPHVVATKDTIDFTTRTGTGQLRIVDHTWQPARGFGGGEALQVQVELVARSGTIGYDPFDFQAFDETGALYDLAAEEVRGPILQAGVLQPGDRISGLVAFAMPRGEVTLLMSDDVSSVTALKIPD